MQSQRNKTESDTGGYPASSGLCMCTQAHRLAHTYTTCTSHTHIHTRGGQTQAHIHTETHRVSPEEGRQRKKDDLFVFVHLCPKTAHWPPASPGNEMQRPGTHTARFSRFSNLENLYASLILIPKPGGPSRGTSTVTSWHRGAGEGRECDASSLAFHYLPKQCRVALSNTDNTVTQRVFSRCLLTSTWP